MHMKRENRHGEAGDEESHEDRSHDRQQRPHDGTRRRRRLVTISGHLQLLNITCHSSCLNEETHCCVTCLAQRPQSKPQPHGSTITLSASRLFIAR
jgi:hypothetical protein